jgi:hypothetical protein
MGSHFQQICEIFLGPYDLLAQSLAWQAVYDYKRPVYSTEVLFATVKN